MKRWIVGLLILTLVLSLGVYVPLSIGLSGPAGLGVDGAWIAATIFLIALGAILCEILTGLPPE